MHRQYTPADIYPYPRAALDLDFIKQRYWWNGRIRQTSEFATYTLNGSTFDEKGLTPTATIDVTVLLSGVGTLVPGSFAFVATQTAAPGTARVLFQMDNTGANERVWAAQATTNNLTFTVIDGGAATASITVTGLGQLRRPSACAANYDTDNFLWAADGRAGTADTSGTLPTVTHLRVGKGTTADSQFLGAISRIILFDHIKTQGALNELSCVLRQF
jgi:hypothetical protein